MHIQAQACRKRSHRAYCFLCFILLCPLGPLFAQTCLEGDCQNGEGTLVQTNGVKYVGQFQDGAYNGIGICYWPNGGGRYEGEWKNNLPHGQGSRLLSTGKRQVGWFENGIYVGEEPSGLQAKAIDRSSTGCISGNCYNGRGVYVYSSGDMYTGWFQNGTINGSGICHFANGSRYEGEWRDSRPHGYGSMVYPSGRECTGQWLDGKPQQACQDNRTASTTTHGCQSGDCRNGEGHIIYMDYSEYRGQFRNGKPHGRGTMDYPNEEQYVGEFEDGQPQGNGKLYRPGKSALEGQWFEGAFVGKQARPSKGCVAGDCQNGNGTYIFQDDSQYTGGFQNGYPHGKGTVVYTNGDRYEGEMEAGYLEGYGILFLPSGKQLSGTWKRGELVQSATAARPPKPAAKAQELNVFAVIIGVAAYTHMRPLNYTDDDAYRMYAFLKSPEGGALDDDHISILIDESATLSNIKYTMEQVFGRAGPNDLIMLYYSGHGHEDAFLPIDFDGFRNKLYHEEIIGLLHRSRAKYKLCIADACYSGGMLAARGRGPDEITQDFYDKLSQAAPGTALIMSSKSDETSLESKGLRQGVFSHFLIRGLKGEADRNQDGYIDITELFNFVSYQVQAYTQRRQSPLIEGDYDRKMLVSVRRK